MKKLVYLIIVIVALGLIVSGCLPVVPPAEKDEATILTKSPQGIDFTGYHYNLNLIGKKDAWSGNGNYEGNRHTMFVPQDTSEYLMDINGEPVEGITIWMTQGVEGDGFEVIDGNAFDEDHSCRFQLAPGYYYVYIAAKGKPNKITTIKGWVWGDETATYYLELGKITVTHKKKPVWNDVTKKLFMYQGKWIFDYIRDLSLSKKLQDIAYFWQYVSNGSKLIQVRFYPVSESELPK